MFHVILWRPEIPPNTGNIIRLCANTGVTLSLVGPLGFVLDEPRLRRAGLDYHEFATVREFGELDACLSALGHPRVWAFSARAQQPFAEAAFSRGDAFLFGPETSGLPRDISARVPPQHRLVIPMRPGSRSLNLSNAVAVAVYEAWRQHQFSGAASDVTHPARTQT